MPNSIHPFALSLCFFSIQAMFLISQAQVPSSSTFKYVNAGEFGEYIAEYDANTRFIPISNSPFQLFFYNTTYNSYTLALRMGTRRSTSLRRWIWEANRGNPVRENATFALGTDGNLVLADYDGRVVWQTNTTNKGVVGLELLPNGNLVLYNKKGEYLWQSFDHPTDTLLVGQSLRAGISTKLISRASIENNIDGPYSFELEPTRAAMYYKSPSSPKPLLYFSTSEWFTIKKGSGILENVTLTSDPRDEDNASVLWLSYGKSGRELPGVGGVGYKTYEAHPYYNSNLSFVRLGIDGNLRFYTYNDYLTWGAWDITYMMFADDSDFRKFDESSQVSMCQLPERCGTFGLCKDSMCVACPTPSGLLGWSENCKPVKVPTCKSSDFKYYKIEGVDHLTVRYTKGNGPVKVEVCERKCTKDCKCVGFFYHKETSRCWTAYDLKTLTKVSNSSNVAYIKTPISSAVHV